MSDLVISKVKAWIMLLIAIVALQFAGANLGAHQLHPGNLAEEADNHPHLQFNAQVTQFSQCVDCTCPGDASQAHASQSATEHQHQQSVTQMEQFDLCLDCQCHGGHVTLLSSIEAIVSVNNDRAPVLMDIAYFPPDPLPSKRPPIA